MIRPFQFGAPPRRPPAENVVPMINVVFLLLVFFLLTATLRVAAPVPVAPPETRLPAARVPAEGLRLHLDAAGTVHWDGLSGEAALAALETGGADGGTLTLHADRGAEAAIVARLLARLAAAGFAATRLVVVEAGP